MAHANLMGYLTELYNRLAKSNLLPMAAFTLVSQQASAFVVNSRSRGEIPLTMENLGVPFIVMIKENAKAKIETIGSEIVDANYIKTLNILTEIVEFHNSQIV